MVKIAGMAAREVAGVHELGGGFGRAMGSLRDRLPGDSGARVSQGVDVEVGQVQTAIDLDIIVDFGVSIPDLTRGVRHNVIRRLERMTGLEVTEVNISVNDVYLGGEDDTDSEPRVL